jgi:GNAT superfamily N-acetyltransferase
MKLEFVDLLGRPELFEPADEIVSGLWPAFMLQDPVAHRHWMGMIRGRPEWQVILLADGEIAGQGNSIPLALEGGLDSLPDEGWDWALEKGMADLAASRACDTLCGIQIAVRKDLQGRGLSPRIVAELKRRAIASGLEGFVVPVRPNAKARFPLIPMASYCRWTRSDGLPYDPWLRVHARLGARILRPCERAMDIRGSVAEWMEWAGLEFPGSGDYVVPGALAPVRVSVEADEGIYIEPNVWVEHDLGEANR